MAVRAKQRVKWLVSPIVWGICRDSANVRQDCLKACVPVYKEILQMQRAEYRSAVPASRATVFSEKAGPLFVAVCGLDAIAPHPAI